MRTNLTVTLTVMLVMGTINGVRGAPIKDNVNWERFLARHDLVWETFPSKWTEGAFLGNGQLGLMIYQPHTPWKGNFFGWTYNPEEKNSLRFDVSRRDISDHRPGGRTLVHEGRLENGHFLLTPVGAITGGDMRLDLLKAESRGTLKTDKGEIAWRAVVLSERNLIIVDIAPSGGEQNCRWEWKPAISEPTRLYKWDRGGHGKDRPQDKYPANPPAEIRREGDSTVSRQPMLAGGDYTTVWKDTHTDDDKRRYYISVAYTMEGTSAGDPLQTVHAAERVPLKALEHKHRQWWQRYYAQSFVSFPHPRIESFYWIQMYKLGAASRADKPAMDLMGPWYQPSIWPGMWWNLNIQLAYYPPYTSNRLQTGENLCRMLDANVSNLVANVKGGKLEAKYDFPPERETAMVARVTAGHDLRGGMFKGQRGSPEVGNLTWAMHNYWRQCRYAADDARIRDAFLPLLRRAVNLYLGMIRKDDDGVYHLPSTYSPEIGYGPDCNYDMALLAWGCRALVSECTRLGIDDPLLPTWKDIIQNLADYPSDENGYAIARGNPLKGSHRHYSHLLMIYPLYLVNKTQSGNRDIIQRSIDFWAHKKGAFAGYSYSGAASMYASIDHGNKAASYLEEMIDRYVHPNTMYTEAESPVIESPLSAAQSVNDMLLQSWSQWDADQQQFVSTIRIFPGVPDTWQDAVFHDLRTENAFLVSARRADALTRWVAVKSLAGKPCRIKPNLDGKVKLAGGRRGSLRALGRGAYALDIKHGETVVLYAGDTKPTVMVDSIEVPDGRYNYFGSGHMDAK